MPSRRTDAPATQAMVTGKMSLIRAPRNRVSEHQESQTETRAQRLESIEGIEGIRVCEVSRWCRGVSRARRRARAIRRCLARTIATVTIALALSCWRRLSDTETVREAAYHCEY